MAANQIQNRIEEQSKKPARVIYTFDVPKSVVDDQTVADPIISISVVALTANEELMATKRARGAPDMRLAYELAKQCLVEVVRVSSPRTAKGEPIPEHVSPADGSADRLWAEMSPKLRNLVTSAYSDVNVVEEGATEVFLKSRKARV